MPKMTVARLNSVNDPLEIGTADIPTPGSTDVLVRVEATGLVPNTYNVLNGHSHHLLPPLPTVPGLDTAGVITAVGKHVVGLEPGQRVYVDPYLTCGTCEACRGGRIELCAAGTLRGYFSNTPIGQPLLERYPIGGFSEYVLSPDRNIVVLPDNLKITTAARLGYAGTSYAGLVRGGLGPGKTLLINGVTGTLGVAAVAIALGLGATKILGIGRNKETLQRVAQLNPGRVFTLSSEEDIEPADWVKDQTKGYGVDVLYDCLGAGADSSSTEALIKAIKPGGRATLVAGSVQGSFTQSYIDCYANVSVAGSMWFTPAEIDTLVRLIGAGVVDLSYLEDQIYPFTEINDAVEFVGSRPGGFTNTVVLPTQASNVLDAKVEQTSSAVSS